MPFQLDHIIQHVCDLHGSIARERERGYNAWFGGVHASGTTHNGLICFADGTYIELMALTGNPPSDPDAVDFSATVRGKPEGIVGWSFHTSDLEATVADLLAHSVPVGEIYTGQRQRADGTTIKWKMAWIMLRYPIIAIQDITPRNLRVPDNPATITHASSATGIDALILPMYEAEIPIFTAMFGEPTEGADKQLIYVLGTSRLILSPDAQAPSLNLR